MFLNLPQVPFARSLSRSPDGSNISEVTLCSPYSPSGDVLGSILKLIELIKDVTGLTKLEIINKEERVGEVKHNYVDISKASRELGYAPKVSLKEGLEETWDFLLALKAVSGVLK